MNPEAEELRYQVVVNVEAQYSIWPDAREIPAGWIYAGVRGTQTECLAYIEAVWKNTRPLSVRMWIEVQETLNASLPTPLPPAKP